MSTGTQVQEQARPEVGEATLAQFVVFNLGDDEFGAEISQVKEVVTTGLITPVPDSPNFVKGVTNVRGDIIAVIDLRKRFSLTAGGENESKHILITRGERSGMGIMVDEVTQVLRISGSEIKEPPQLLEKIHERYLRGVVTLDDRLIMLLDLGTVLSDDELARLAEVQRQHQETGEVPSEQGAPEEASPNERSDT